ncbi:exopolysaccharide biosynthesis protein [Spirulina sp. CS-785/01]|uniref:exopolysaccharide biosynthesis protein n=1 Tax=Spirulina sp. CS-785/01 TaxID=3021716 RepID=UPI003FA6C794
MAKLSIELNRYLFAEDHSQPKVRLADFLALAGERGFGVLFVVLSLPSALPVPAPGYSIPFGIVIFVLTVQFMVGVKSPLLFPQLANRGVKWETAQKFVQRGTPWLKRFEGVAKPRLTWVCTTIPGRLVLGTAIALMSISMMIPIPGTNTLPALSIFITGLGLVEDDGVISLGGLLTSVLILILMVSVILAAIYGGTSLIDYLKDLLMGNG